MLTTILCFIAGLLLGLLSLRLLSLWEPHGSGERRSGNIFRHR